MSVGHYENFPVASRLVPAALRPAIVAIYRFARAADDLADEGDATPDERVQALAAFGSQAFGVGQPRYGAARVKNDGGSDDGTRQRAAPGFVHASKQRLGTPAAQRFARGFSVG